jgi:hypothetical protein
MPNVVVNRRGAYAASVANRCLGFVLVASRRSHIWRIWERWFKCNLSIPPPFIEKIAGGSIPINQGGRDYHVKLHFHLRYILF